MWLLPTMDRPQQCQRVLEACWDTGMRSKGVVYVDSDNPVPYKAVKLPPNWLIHYHGSKCGIRHSMNWIYKVYPDELNYGWIADDNYPETMGWCEIMEREAGEWRITIAYDKYLCDTEHLEQIKRGELFTSAQCFGGGLVRHLGYWAFPRVRQVGIDWIWGQMVVDTGIVKYLPDVCVRHDHYLNGKRPYDATDKQSHESDYMDDYMEAKAFLRRDKFEAARKWMETVTTEHPEDN